jgi:hypothetical protein
MMLAPPEARADRQSGLHVFEFLGFDWVAAANARAANMGAIPAMAMRRF